MGTTSPNGTPTILDLDPAHWQTMACHLAGRNLTGAEWNQYLPDGPIRRPARNGQRAHSHVGEVGDVGGQHDRLSLVASSSRASSAPAIAAYRAAVSARCGSFQPGRGKWQVYPWG